MVPIVEKRSIIKWITASWVGYWSSFDGDILNKILVLVRKKQNKINLKQTTAVAYHGIHTGSQKFETRFYIRYKIFHLLENKSNIM